MTYTERSIRRDIYKKTNRINHKYGNTLKELQREKCMERHTREKYTKNATEIYTKGHSKRNIDRGKYIEENTQREIEREKYTETHK